MKYRPRVVDAELRRRLQVAGAVVIEGAKACGKTETARQIAASEVLLDVDDTARAAAAISPGLVLAGETPRLIDEWQVEPKLWNHVRREVDSRRRPGQFILAGSASPADDATRHAGAGRFGRLQMRTMSLFESGMSSGVISLADVLEGVSPGSPETGLTIPDVADAIAHGGWPGFHHLSTAQAQQGIRDYLDQIRRTDIRAVEGIRRDPEKVDRLLRSLARNVATHVSAATLAADTDGPDGPLKKHTAGEYLAALARLFIIEDQPAWTPHLRSRYALRRAAKRHLVDPSLAVAALHASPAALLRDLNFLGLLFESMVVRDLRVYSQAAEALVLQYRDSDNLEVDAIVRANDGRWAAFEIKLGGDKLIAEGAASLLTFSRRIDTSKCGVPAALGVIVATGYGYVRDDGVHVIPIGSLGP